MPIRDDLAQVTMELIAIPSVTDDAAGREAVIAWTERFCARLPGIHVVRYESDGKPSLVVSFDEKRHKALVLNAHLDVVPARAEQFRPYLKDGRIYGRGSQDMKGAAAAMLLLLRDLAESGQRPDIAWQFVTDEEIGGDHGTGYLLQQGYTSDFFIAGEPTDLEIVNRAKGPTWITISQPGNPAHGSRPWDGSNPIVPLAAGIMQLMERYPSPTEQVWKTTVTPTTIHAGDAQNRIADDCVLQLDIRRIASDTPDEIMAEVRRCFPTAEVKLYHPGTTLETSENDPHVQRLSMILEDRPGGQARFRSEHFASDARWYSKQQIPAVCFGPIGAGLHSHEEWVDLASLEQFYDVIRDLAQKT